MVGGCSVGVTLDLRCNNGMLKSPPPATPPTPMKLTFGRCGVCNIGSSARYVNAPVPVCASALQKHFLFVTEGDDAIRALAVVLLQQSRNHDNGRSEARN